MSKGKRYNHEPKLNIKKVIAVFIMLMVIVALVIAMKKLATPEEMAGAKQKEYYAFYQDGQWGVIDSQAKIVISPTYTEAIIIPDHTKDVFICTENVDYDKGTYTSKIMNAKNKPILKKYTQVEAIENYDQHHNLWYEENVLIYKNHQNQYGLINFDGKVILEAAYDEITSLKGKKGVLITKKEDKVGLVNTQGAEIIPNQYSSISSLGGESNQYIVENQSHQYGIYGVLEEEYQEILPLGNQEYFCVKQNNQYRVINKEKDKVMKKAVDNVTQIKDNILVYQINQKYQAYDIENKKTLDNNYDKLIYTANDYFIAKKGKSYGIVDLQGHIKEKINYANIIYHEAADMYELEEKNNTSGVNKILNNQLQDEFHPLRQIMSVLFAIQEPPQHDIKKLHVHGYLLLL